MNNVLRAQIVELEERLRLAMLHSDTGVLNELLAPELIFTNHLGHLLRRQNDIDLHESGALQLKELVPSEQHIQLHHRFAVVSVLMHLRGAYEGKPIDLSIRYTRIWAASPSGAMQITAGHASAMPSN